MAAKRRARRRPAGAYARLRDLIRRGELQPGARLVETALARRLGLSRTPVRAALQRLAQDGYALGRPDSRQARLRVAPLSPGDLREVFALVGALEGLAAESAARLPSPERVRLAAAIERDNRALQRAFRARRPDYDRLLALHQGLHGHCQAAAGPRLRALLEAVRPQAERYEWAYGPLLPEGIEPAAAEHAALAEALRAGDAELARRRAEENWRNAAARLAPAVERAAHAPVPVDERS